MTTTIDLIDAALVNVTIRSGCYLPPNRLLIRTALLKARRELATRKPAVVEPVSWLPGMESAK